MKVLVVGGGGREHALAWKLAQSDKVQQVYVAPGNGGTARDPNLVNLPITDIAALRVWAQAEKIGVTVGTRRMSTFGDQKLYTPVCKGGARATCHPVATIGKDQSRCMVLPSFFE